MSDQVVIEIERWHPATLNQLMRNRWVAQRLKKQDRNLVWAYTRSKPKAMRKRRVELTIILKPGQKAADVDAYHKSLLDALKHAGMLIDDNPRRAVLAPDQYERGTETRWGTRIVLTDL